MKRKILICGLLLSVFFSGIAVAGPLYGMFEGNPIIRLTSGGTPLKVADVPPVKLKNRTMVPVYLLRQAGMQVTWDEGTQTVDAKIPHQLTEAEITTLSRSVGLIYATDATGDAQQGSGFVIDHKGKKVFVTNYHVAGKAVKFLIKLDGKEITTAEKLFANESTDLYGLTLTTDAPALPYMKETALLGTNFWLIGYPLQKYTVSKSWVNYIGKVSGNITLSHSAASDHGNSGAPLFDESGTVMGIQYSGYDRTQLAISTSYLYQELSKMK